MAVRIPMEKVDECERELAEVHFCPRCTSVARSNAGLCLAPSPRGDPSSNAPASVLRLAVLACAAKKVDLLFDGSQIRTRLRAPKATPVADLGPEDWRSGAVTRTHHRFSTLNCNLARASTVEIFSPDYRQKLGNGPESGRQNETSIIFTTSSESFAKP